MSKKIHHAIVLSVALPLLVVFLTPLVNHCGNRVVPTERAASAEPYQKSNDNPQSKSIKPQLVNKIVEFLYDEPHIGKAPGNQKVKLDTAILAQRDGVGDFFGLAQGAPLRSRRDKYWMEARSASQGYLYVVQIDAANNVYWIFPRNETCGHSSGANPIRSGERIRIPASSKSVFTLDETVGYEHVYFILVSEPWPALEKTLKERSQLEATRTEQSSENPVRQVNAPFQRGLRGIGGVESTSVSVETQAAFSGNAGMGHNTTHIGSGLITAESPGALLVVERFFQHTN